MPTPPSTDAPASPLEIEAEALRCDGPALMRRGAQALRTLNAESGTPSASLLAAWEAGRAFDKEGRIDAASVQDMLPRFASALGMNPPRWWIETLESARGGEGVATSYDLGMTATGDRRGPIAAGPGGVHVRPGPPLVESGGQLAYDLSMGRVELGATPPASDPVTAVEVTRARAGTTLYVAMFEPGSGGFRFPVRAVGSDGKERWTTEVCAADRKVLRGRGYMIVQMVMLEDPPANPGVMGTSNARGLAVFTAESHGVTVEVFELDKGARTLAWSSDLWSSRG